LSGTEHNPEHFAQTVPTSGHLFADRGSAKSGCAALLIQETLMAGVRKDSARARARDLLATYYPVPEDAEFPRLRELAADYIQQAGQLEAETRGHAVESDELISAAFDAVARDFFKRTVLRAASRKQGR
jgi:hypothetical protein